MVHLLSAMPWGARKLVLSHTVLPVLYGRCHGVTRCKPAFKFKLSSVLWLTPGSLRSKRRGANQFPKKRCRHRCRRNCQW